MLILERAINEEILIGPDIVIRFLGVRDYKARIGITAPRNIAVHRREVAERIARELQETP